MNSKLSYHKWTLEKVSDLEKKYILNWSIPNFIWLMNNQTNRKIEPDKCNEEDECKFEVKIQFVGHENDLVEIYYKTHESIFVEPSFFIYKKNIHSNQYQPTFDYSLISNTPDQLAPKNEWQLLAVLYKRMLKAQDHVATLNNVNYGFHFQFQFLVSDKNSSNNLPTKQPCLPVSEKEAAEIPDCNLINDLTSLLMNQTLSDVTLKSTEGDEFPAHKNFLVTRSAVFKAHFEHNTVESISNVVEFPFDTDVLKDVLTYIYTDDTPNVDKLSGKLLAAAEFYQLNGLKKRCVQALDENLTVENAIETLELANLYRVMYLKRRTLEFIKGIAEDITETEGWKVSQSTELIKSVYEYVVKDKFILS